MLPALTMEPDELEKLIPTSALLAALHVTDSDWCWQRMYDRTTAGPPAIAAFVDMDIDYAWHWIPGSDLLWSWQWTWLEKNAVHRLDRAADLERERHWGLIVAHLAKRDSDLIDRAHLRDALQRFLHHPDGYLRATLAYVAIDPRSDDDILALTNRFLGDESSRWERTSAAIVLTQLLQDPSRTDEQFERYAGEFDQLLRHPDMDVRRIGVTYMRAIPHFLPPNRVDRIRTAISLLRDHPDEDLHRAWMRTAVALAPDEEQVRTLIHVELARPDPESQAYVLQAAMDAQFTSDELINVALHLFDGTPSGREADWTISLAEGFLSVQSTADLLPHYERISDILERRQLQRSMLYGNLYTRPEWRAFAAEAQRTTDDPPEEDPSQDEW